MSLGNGEDYVGSCINVASRLQKLPGLTFAVAQKGIDLDEVKEHAFWKEITVRQVALRGIGEDELIYAHGSEIATLKARDRKFYRE